MINYIAMTVSEKDPMSAYIMAGHDNKVVLKLGPEHSGIGVTIDRDRMAELIQVLRGVAPDNTVEQEISIRISEVVEQTLAMMVERNLQADIGRMQFASGEFPL